MLRQSIYTTMDSSIYVLPRTVVVRGETLLHFVVKLYDFTPDTEKGLEFISRKAKFVVFF